MDKYHMLNIAWNLHDLAKEIGDIVNGDKKIEDCLDNIADAKIGIDYLCSEAGWRRVNDKVSDRYRELIRKWMEKRKDVERI